MEVKDYIRRLQHVLYINTANFFTIINLGLGFFALVWMFQDRLTDAAYLIMFAMLADGLDGKISKKLGVSSDFGKELDSLSDLISFGLAPAILIYRVFLEDLGTWGILISCFYCVCGALRLARFNTKSGQEGFEGVPITIAGGILACISLIEYMGSCFVIIPLMIITSFLMVSTMSFYKMDIDHIHSSPWIFGFLAVCTIGIIIFKEFFILVAIGTYILHGLLCYIKNKLIK